MRPIIDLAEFVDCDQVARTFGEMYAHQQQESGDNRPNASDEWRIKAAYSIHPELFDRLRSDWSTLEKSQKTQNIFETHGGDHPLPVRV